MLDRQLEGSFELKVRFVSFFGAPIGLGKQFQIKSITTSLADSMVKQMDFYKLVRPTN